MYTQFFEVQTHQDNEVRVSKDDFKRLMMKKTTNNEKNLNGTSLPSRNQNFQSDL